MDREKIFLWTVGGVCVLLLTFVLLLPSPANREGEEFGSLAGIGQEELGLDAFAQGGEGGEGGEGDESVTVEDDLGPAEEVTEEGGDEDESYLSERNRRDVVLFFQDARSDFLGSERRQIFLTASTTDQAKQIVVELINGPQRSSLLPTIPPETHLLGVYLDRHGTAYVDLSEEAVAFHPGGSAEELATIFSLVNSLTYNLRKVKRVRILIGGDERETLKSHLDLKRDYVQDLSIVARRP